MARQYVVDDGVRRANRIMSFLTNLGIGISQILTVPGRVSGEPVSVPVTPIDFEGSTYLVGPYGDVNWTKNLRAAGGGTMSKRRKTIEFTATEVTDPDQAGRVLHHYATKIRLTRPYFDAQPDDGPEAYALEADAHPVFRVD